MKPTCDFTPKPTSVVTTAHGVWRPVCMATKDVTISETRTNTRRHIQDDSDLKTNKSWTLLLQSTIKRASLNLSYSRQRKGHFQLFRRGTYDETITRNGALLNGHFPLPTKKRVTSRATCVINCISSYELITTATRNICAVCETRWRCPEFQHNAIKVIREGGVEAQLQTFLTTALGGGKC